MMEVVVFSKSELNALIEDVAERTAQRMQAARGDEVTAEGVADLLSVSVRTVRRMELRGELPKKLGRRWKRADIVRWRDERRQT